MNDISANLNFLPKLKHEDGPRYLRSGGPYCTTVLLVLLQDQCTSTSNSEKSRLKTFVGRNDCTTRPDVVVFGSSRVFVSVSMVETLGPVPYLRNRGPRS